MFGSAKGLADFFNDLVEQAREAELNERAAKTAKPLLSEFIVNKLPDMFSFESEEDKWKSLCLAERINHISCGCEEKEIIIEKQRIIGGDKRAEATFFGFAIKAIFGLAAASRKIPVADPEIMHQIELELEQNTQYELWFKYGQHVQHYNLAKILALYAVQPFNHHVFVERALENEEETTRLEQLFKKQDEPKQEN